MDVQWEVKQLIAKICREKREGKVGIKSARHSFMVSNRICCLGDSITEMGRWIYNVNSLMAANGTDIRLYNCGISGNSADMAVYYIEDEVMWLCPESVLVMFGTNDVGQHLYKKGQWEEELTNEDRIAEIIRRRENYISSIDMLCKMFRGRGVKVILMTPVPFHFRKQDTVNPEINREIRLYADQLKEYARKSNVPLIDLFSLFSERKNNAEIYGSDGIHPNESGHKIIAAAVMKMLGVNISIPGNDRELNAFMVKETEENNKRFEIEQKLRKCALLDWGKFHPLHEDRYGYFGSWHEIAIGMVKRCIENHLEWWENREWLESATLNYITNRPVREELRKELIKITESMK